MFESEKARSVVVFVVVVLVVWVVAVSVCVMRWLRCDGDVGVGW